MTWRNQPAPPRPLPPHRPQRFAWCKIPNEFPDYPALRAAALVANVPVHQVVAVALRLECLANASMPRGSVADFSAIEFAAALQLRPDVVGRIRAALEDPDVYWIDQDVIAGFQARNPESSDPTAADRQRRRRAKLKAEQEAVAQNGDNLSQGPPPIIHSHVTSRRDVTVSRDRVDKNKKPLDFDDARARPPVENCADSGDDSAQTCDGQRTCEGQMTCEGQRPESPETARQQLALLWLNTEGVRIVTEQMHENRTLAATTTARWCDQELAGDAASLANIIRGAQDAGYFGDRFLNLIVDGVRDAKRRATAQGELRLQVRIDGDRKAG